MAQTPNPAPDETTKVIGVAYLLANIVWFVLSNYSKIIGKVKKRKTDENDTVKAILNRDDTIDDLEKQLNIQVDEIKRLTAMVDYLKQYENEVVTIRDINKLHEKRLQEQETALREKDMLISRLQGMQPTKPITPPSTE